MLLFMIYSIIPFKKYQHQVILFMKWINAHTSGNIKIIKDNNDNLLISSHTIKVASVAKVRMSHLLLDKLHIREVR